MKILLVFALSALASCTSNTPNVQLANNNLTSSLEENKAMKELISFNLRFHFYGLAKSSKSTTEIYELRANNDLQHQLSTTSTELNQAPAVNTTKTLNSAEKTTLQHYLAEHIAPKNVNFVSETQDEEVAEISLNIVYKNTQTNEKQVLELKFSGGIVGISQHERMPELRELANFLESTYFFR